MQGGSDGDNLQSIRPPAGTDLPLGHGSWTLLSGMILHEEAGLTRELKRCKQTLKALDPRPHTEGL